MPKLRHILATVFVSICICAAGTSQGEEIKNEKMSLACEFVLYHATSDESEAHAVRDYLKNSSSYRLDVSGSITEIVTKPPLAVKINSIKKVDGKIAIKISKKNNRILLTIINKSDDRISMGKQIVPIKIHTRNHVVEEGMHKLLRVSRDIGVLTTDAVLEPRGSSVIDISKLAAGFRKKAESIKLSIDVIVLLNKKHYSRIVLTPITL